MLSWVVSLSYAQYPITKRIGKDSVVIITVKQGDYINERFDQLDSTNRILNDSVLIMNDSIIKLNKTLKISKEFASKYYFMYEENRRMYIDREKEFRRENTRHTIRYLILATVILFQTIVVR